MSSITLFSEDRQNYVKIERTGYESYDSSQRLAITVSQDSFRGSVGIWVENSAFVRFVKQLEKCEELRRGEVSLNAMSPQDFSLRIFNTHPKGDFAINYEVSDPYSRYLAQLKGGFDLDASLLPQIQCDFEAFLIPSE
jgi:hypothetical protein